MKVCLTRIAYRRWERCEIGNWLMHCTVQSLTNPDLACSLIPGMIDYSPVEAARNIAVENARRREAAVLIMIDDDMIPSREFFGVAIRHLKEHPDSVIGSPACGARPERLVNVSVNFGTPPTMGVLQKVSRSVAAKKTGIERVWCMGAGMIAIGMRALERIKPPYFASEYSDDLHTFASTTEDMYFTRKLSEAGGSVFCAWDNWSEHCKVEAIGKPEVENDDLVLNP